MDKKTHVEHIAASYQEMIERAQRVLAEVLELAETAPRLDWQWTDLALADDSPEWQRLFGLDTELTARLSVMYLALHASQIGAQHSTPHLPWSAGEIMGDDLPPAYERWFTEWRDREESMVALGRRLEHQLGPDV